MHSYNINLQICFNFLQKEGEKKEVCRFKSQLNELVSGQRVD